MVSPYTELPDDDEMDRAHTAWLFDLMAADAEPPVIVQTPRRFDYAANPFMFPDYALLRAEVEQDDA